MAMPTDVGIIDTMIGFPHKDMKEVYAFITRQTKDRESKEDFAFPVEYMFKQVPEKEYLDVDDPISVTLHEMDRWGIEKGVIGVGDAGGVGELALKRHPERFIPQAGADPNQGMDAVREHRARRTRRTACDRSACFPAGTFPQVAINDKKMYPIYAKCVELGLPVFCCAGVPGPRLQFEPQRVEYIDEVMYDFPELVFVTRHGCEPWQDLAVKLMLKWPGPALLDQCVRAEALPEGHHRLRQHARGRQDHLRRLLPDGAVDRAHHDRDAERRVQGRSVAEVPPRQRDARARARRLSS